MKKCELDIAKGIVKKAVEKTVTKTIVPVSSNSVFIPHTIYPKGQAYRIAESIVKNIDKLFNDHMSYREDKPDGQLITFKPSQKLVREKYNEYLKNYEAEIIKQSEEVQRQDATRAEIPYTRDYLFDNNQPEGPVVNKSTIQYSGVFFNTSDLVIRYGQVHSNLYSHHSTIEFRPSDISGLDIGETKTLKITGRLTTDKVDVLLVDNPESKNKYPHITLSTAEGVKPAESNIEIENNLDKIQPLKASVTGVIGYSENDKDITSVADMSFKIINNASILDLSEKEKNQIYDNYNKMMNRKREGKAIDKETFDYIFNNLQVYNYKGTYIFGEWDNKNGVFKGRLLSSPNIKELFSAVDVIKNNINFVAAVPDDIGSMLEKKGFFKLDINKEYNFKGEDMLKNLYFTDKALAEKVFKKPIEKITKEDVEKYDTFYSYWGKIASLKEAYENKDYQLVYQLLTEIGIYNRNAYRLFKKMKLEEITEKDINGVVQDIIKNSSLNKVAINSKDLLNNPKIYKKLDNELNKTLAKYLSKFGIKTELLEDIQDKLGIDSFAHVDILNKILYADINNQTEYPQQAGKIIAYMMQHNPLVQSITSDMKKHSMFKHLVTQEETLDAIGDLIALNLHQKTNTKVPEGLIDLIKNLIRQFINLLNNIQIKNINKNIGFITDNILMQNESLITQSQFKPGAEGKKISRISLEEALKADDFGNSIVERMAKYFILTGSITLSQQGTVYRPDENQMHDIDWVSPVNRAESIRIFEELYPDSKYVREISNEDFHTDTWVIVPQGYKIENLVITGKMKKVESYDIVDLNGDVVSTYDGNTDSHTGDVVGKMIDIFAYETNIESKTAHKNITLKSGTPLRIADWRNTFAAKLAFGRLKDIWDYNRFIPEDNVYTPEPDLEREQQIQDDLQELKLTSDVVDVLYLQSSKRVTKEEFTKIAFKMISILQPRRTTEQIIEALKCI